jgi:hypothetical protein
MWLKIIFALVLAGSAITIVAADRIIAALN